MGIYLGIILAFSAAAFADPAPGGSEDPAVQPDVVVQPDVAVDKDPTAPVAPASDGDDLVIDPTYRPSEEEHTRFRELNAIQMADQGVRASVIQLPAGITPPNPEHLRAAAFDKQFCPQQPGCYRAAADFKDNCNPEPPARCNRLAAGQLITGGDKFATLENEVAEGKVQRGSQDYENRRGGIKGEMRAVVREISPRHGASSSYTQEFIKIADPVVKQVFTPKEREQFAHNLAGTTGSAPAYNYLGETHNELGSPGQAVQAFDAALERDPGSRDALSGRAQANFSLGNFPAAARDAAAALAIDPNDARAYATLKLSENRAPASGGGLAAAAAGGGQAAPAGRAGSGPSLPGASPAEAAETARRAAALAAEARRSLGMNDASRAVGILDRAIAASPGDAGSYLLRAMARARTGDFRGALADAEAGLRLRPRDASLLVAKSYSLNRLKDYRGALDAARLAREIDPDSADAMAAFAHAAGGLGRREEMLALLGEAAAKDGRYAASLASAQSMPAGADLLFLFPGETMPASASAGAGAMGGVKGKRRLGWLAGASLLGGLIVAMLFLQGAAGTLTRKLKTMVQGVPAEPLPTLAASRALPEALRGQYRFERQIGSGGMGLVYLGTDLSLSRPVAIKKMREELRADERERRRFLEEARTVAALHHPNIVDIYAVVEEGPDVFLVFEYVDGETVYDILCKRKTLALSQTAGIVRGMAAALDYAHGQGVIHRDLKPSNVMIDRGGFIKVMDFGIARAAKDAATRVAMTNTIIGTPPYMAPESERGEIRKEGDVFALAACAYEMLTGKPAFTGAGMLMNKIDMAFVPPTHSVPSLPAGVDEVVRKGLEADPAKRFHTAGEFVKALEGLSV
jgi:tetratricopeptide (TPR) repeat protein